MTVSFSGFASVLDRTIFTGKGPIVKRPLSLLTGSNLRVVSATDVDVPTGNFSSSDVGKLLEISGSPNGRNDGRFRIDEALSKTRLRLGGASLSVLDLTATVVRVCSLANELKDKFNAHRLNLVSHGDTDLINQVTSPFAVDMTSAITLVNELRAKVLSHVLLDSPIHAIPDEENVPTVAVADGIGTLVSLVNDVRESFDHHRKSLVHTARDNDNRVRTQYVAPVVGTGPDSGPHTWTLFNPRIGEIADDPSDVVVRVNGTPVLVDAVFGLLGAVVLSAKPSSGSNVQVDYDFMSNPPTQMLRMNSWEFVLNQAGLDGQCGLPGHKYKARSYLIHPGDVRDMRSPQLPTKVGWKYKGFELAGSALLNQSSTLLTNTPVGKLRRTVLFKTIQEVVIGYDAVTLPDMASDPWTFSGVASTDAIDGHELLLQDSSFTEGTSSRPPFYYKSVDLSFPCSVSSAFRLRAAEDVPDGAMVGPAFGICDGPRLAIVGLLLTPATGISSAIDLVSSIRSHFSSHLVEVGMHRPSDSGRTPTIPAAQNLDVLLLLANQIRSLFNSHVLDASVHMSADNADVVTSPAATTLAGAITLVNELRIRYNAHVISGVHWASTPDEVPQVRQVGILIDAGRPSLSESWSCSQHDWTLETTYRLARDAVGSVQLYAGGSVDSLAQVSHTALPASSAFDADMDLAQQIFFGSLSREASSTSRWTFVRADITPVDSVQLPDNKSVIYDPSIVPEEDSFAPWITVGQGGREFSSVSSLTVDSTASVSSLEQSQLGDLSGAYRGFLRLEPVLQDSTASSIEFGVSVAYNSFSVDNESVGVFLDDGLLSTHLLFLQSSPSPATVTSTAVAFSIAPGDSLIFAVDGGITQTVTWGVTSTTVNGAASVINTAVGFPFASPTSGPGQLVLTSATSGASSQIRIDGGRAAEKLGISPGFYFGKDSNPEPRVSWSGANPPGSESPPWESTGDQPSDMMGRTLRITDSDASDFRVFSFSDPLYTESVFGSPLDWKLDVRLEIISHTSGTPVASGSNLRPCGAMVVVDEGIVGKSVELHLVDDVFGTPYVAVYSYHATTNVLTVVAEYPFDWRKGIHSYNLFTNKGADLCMVLADGAVLGTFSYSTLAAGILGPAVTFGSGGSAVANADLRTSQSVVDWHSVFIMKDGKISDPSAPSRRFIGLYKGGDSATLSSYYLHQVDWTVPHVYKIVRDPRGSVSVYVDSARTPSISVNYDVLSLPPSSASFLAPLCDRQSCVAFGSFSSSEMSRTVWTSLNYSLGRITLTDRRVVGHHVLNRSSIMTSPDHLISAAPHAHSNFRQYSGGVPTDDFLGDPNVPAYTVLGKGTPPVPMTQDVQARGGMVKTTVLVRDIQSSDLVNTPGTLADLDDDVGSSISLSPAANTTQNRVVVVNLIKKSYLDHLSRSRVHVSRDLVDVPTLPDAVDEPTAVALANQLKALYNFHIVAASGDSGGKVHVANDVTNGVVTADATGGASLGSLLESLRTSFNSHIVEPGVHGASVFIRIEPPPRAVYSRTRFYRQESGTPELVAPAGDEVTGILTDGSTIINLTP